MKCVLISIHPEWCEKIASGEKTLEVRKTRPKLETPFKCYIYCTKGDPSDAGDVFYLYDPQNEFRPVRGNQKIIGEFVCDKYIIDRTFGHDSSFNASSCMTIEDIASYCTAREMYGWHISNQKIYDKPKGLNKFRKPIDCHRGKQRENCVGCWDCKIERPPQSWCYVEELEE